MKVFKLRQRQNRFQFEDQWKEIYNYSYLRLYVVVYRELQNHYIENKMTQFESTHCLNCIQSQNTKKLSLAYDRSNVISCLQHKNACKKFTQVPRVKNVLVKRWTTAGDEFGARQQNRRRQI